MESHLLLINVEKRHSCFLDLRLGIYSAIPSLLWKPGAQHGRHDGSALLYKLTSSYTQTGFSRGDCLPLCPFQVLIVKAYNSLVTYSLPSSLYLSYSSEVFSAFIM